MLIHQERSKTFYRQKNKFITLFLGISAKMAFKNIQFKQQNISSSWDTFLIAKKLFSLKGIHSLNGLEIEPVYKYIYTSIIKKVKE